MYAVMNLAMASAMSISADLLHGGITTRTFLMIPIGALVGLLLNFFVPYDRISQAIFKHVRGKQIRYFLFALPPAILQTAAISAVMTAIGLARQHVGLQGYLSAYATTTLLLIPIAYIVALAVQPLALYAAGLHKHKENGDRKSHFSKNK